MVVRWWQKEQEKQPRDYRKIKGYAKRRENRKELERENYEEVKEEEEGEEVEEEVGRQELDPCARSM